MNGPKGWLVVARRWGWTLFLFEIALKGGLGMKL